MTVNRLSSLLSDTYEYLMAADKQLSLEEVKADHLIRINDCPDGMVAIKLPSSGPGVFAGKVKGMWKGGYNQICDYLLFIPRKDCVEIILCEMTKTVYMPRNEHLEKGQQIKCTVPLLHYIMQGMNTHFDMSVKYNLHYIVLCEKITAKKDKDDELTGRHSSDGNTTPSRKAPTYIGGTMTDYAFEYDKMPISIHVCTGDIPISKLINLE